MRRLERGVVERLSALGEQFQIAHLNHPALAASFRPWAKSVLVAGWFYPHDLFQRIGATWGHTRGSPLRRGILTVKSVSYFLGDAHGYRAADAVVVPTELLAGQLRGQGIRAMVCPPPVRVAEGREVFQQPQEASVGKRLVACAGDLSHARKNLMDAIDALKLLSPSVRPVHLEMIGGNAEKLCARATRLPEGISVSFPGSLKPFEVQQRMRRADALVLPSLYEEWGYVAIEALLMGTPVITYPVYPFREMLGDDLGFVASDRRLESLANAIERALSENRRPDLAQVAASRFGAKAVGETLMRIWGNVANI
jgi:glycosyltransferase involved in cell wall biosynthesis